MHRNKTRDEAIIRGEDRYLDKPCKMSHPGWKYVSNYSCVDCSALKNKAWMNRHAEERKEWKKQYLIENADKVKAYLQSESAIASRNKLAQKRTKRGDASYNTMLGRMRRMNRLVKWDEEFTEFVAREAHYLARLRDETTKIKWSVDHIIPLRSKKVSGLHTWNNLQVIPMQINRLKSAKLGVLA